MRSQDRSGSLRAVAGLATVAATPARAGSTRPSPGGAGATDGSGAPRRGSTLRRALAASLVAAAGVTCGGSECRVDDDCGPDAYCEGSPCAENDLGCEKPCDHPALCRARVAEGARCEGDHQCARGLLCADGGCATPQPAGAPCRRDVECEEGLACNQAGHACSPLGSVGAGAACDREALCGADLTCVAGACLPALREGSPCSGAPGSCADALACDGGFCRAR